MSSKFLTESTGEKIVKIGQYLTKIWTKYDSLVFFGHPVDASIPKMMIYFWYSWKSDSFVASAVCVGHLRYTDRSEAAFTLRTTSYDHVRRRTTSYVPAHIQSRTLLDVKCVVSPAPEHSPTALLTSESIYIAIYI